MNGANPDELIEVMQPEKNRHPIPRRNTTETAFGILIVIVLYVGIILAFLTNF